MTYTQEEIIKANGPFTPPETFSMEYIEACIEQIRLFPEQLSAFLKLLGPDRQNATYREGGWNFRQVSHHLADSHMQAFSRFKLALTEDRPIIKPYSQNDWANTPENGTDAEASAALITALHKRWVVLLKSMTSADFQKTYIHPEYGKEFSLAYATGLYAWHGSHHLTQMHRYAENMSWI